MLNLYILLLGISLVWGHGSSFYPNPWHATSNCDPNLHSPLRCKFDLEIFPSGCTVGFNGCDSTAGRTAWFTNYTSVPKMTIDKELLGKGRRFKSSAGFHPWTSPGAAKTYGNGCGLNGGNPDGCDGEDNVFGRCCGSGRPRGDSQGGRCNGYVGGKPAPEHYQDGLFGTPTVTTWTRGQPAEVYWASAARHKGGYAYRLCKVNEGKFWEVTEECFQQGHLNFHGTQHWIYPYFKNNIRDYSPDNWIARTLVTTTKGTTPKGSMWAKIDLPEPPKTSSVKGYMFKDVVEVPENLEPGDYVLSYRWDCERTPQVWNSCANINIVQ